MSNSPNHDLPPLRPATVANALRTVISDLRAGNIEGAHYLLGHLVDEFDLDAAIIEWSAIREIHGEASVRQ